MAWTGALRIYKCNDCCKRWYFTFNDAECSAPLPIDGVMYMWHGSAQDIHRVRHIEGHCNNIHKGKVRVGFWVGNCPSGSGRAGDAYTGWQSVSRIFIEEVPKAQAKMPRQNIHSAKINTIASSQFYRLLGGRLL